MNKPKLKIPDYKKISSTAMTNPGDSLTVISLGQSITINAIEKNEVVATCEINSTSFQCLSLEDYESGVSEIYVIIPGNNHSGNIKITIKDNLIENSITIIEEDCYNIYSLYYGQNFETLDNMSNFCKSSNISPTIDQDNSYGKYLQATSASNNGTSYSIVNLNIPEEGNYILEFDAHIANSNTNANNTSFYILSEENNTDYYLLKMFSNTYNNGSNNMDLKFNITDYSISLSQSFFHYKLIVDRISNQISLSIYELDGDVIFDKKILEKSSSASYIAKSFYISIPKGARGLIRLSNISVYSYEGAKINPTFTQREIKLSLNSDIKFISSINKSIYCSTSYEDTEVTFKSVKEGKSYIYIEGILNINDNKCWVLVIINVDERGYIYYEENRYIFSMDINFDKIPSTIQKEYQTYSTLDGLNTDEPEDNPNITPRVNVEELNSKFSQFIPEKLIKPRVKVAFCITNNKWCILYTNDSEITDYSEYILYNVYYEGLLDCINKSFSHLTSGRETKEKISIITSGSTNTPPNNTNSKVSSNNRMYRTLAIKCSDYVILDFEDNYIYMDNSETYTSDSINYKIGTFIDMERGAKFITICNLILMGNVTYGFFLAQAREILFQNITMTIAKGEHSTISIGIRPQSQENAIANVALSRWSHDLYFDNCVFNGLSEHGIETFNSYNVYMTEIKSTDCEGNGILLNCSYNVWINRIISIRCCTSATYAAVRFANDAGPNINIHYVYGESSGNGVFLVSSCNDIHIDKINLVNICSTPIYVGGSAGLQIKSGQIISNGGEAKYYIHDGTIGTKKATQSNAIFIVAGSSSQFLPQWNNVFENIKIDGFKSGYTERYKMSSNFNVYNNIDTTGCKQTKEVSSDGTGTIYDVPFGFCVIDNLKGPGNEQITGDKILSGDYTYALNSDSTSYIIMEYSGLDSVIIIPKKFRGKPISRIGSFAFYGNKNIISLTIDKNIESLGGLSFGNCSSLKSLTFLSGGSYEIGHCAFRGCERLQNVNLTDVKILRASCFAWCKNLREVICPKSVVYFGSNCFYNDNIDLTIECEDSSKMTVEPYAFYYIGFNSKIYFTGINQPTDLKSYAVTATGNPTYYYRSHSFVEENVYKEGIWVKYYYHVAVTPTFKE